uniref:TATA box-binding protein-associated factor RNA polymerase I subunit B n=1 Tax=Panagrellus redivivus TaxID=6233 RepID=A0A7E4VEG8_PANRE
MNTKAFQPACDSCGNRKYGLIDGFYYCTVCNAQSQQLVEYEAEADTVIGVTHMRKKTGRKKKAAPTTSASTSKANSRFMENGRNMAPIKHWTLNDEDYPRYLRQTGRRLTTFARLLVQFCNRLHHNFGVPKSIFKIANYLLQKHFAHLGIAFCDAETVDETEAGHTYNQRLLLAEYKLKQREVDRQRQAFIDKRRADISAKNFDDVWGFLNQTQEEVDEIEQSIMLEANQSISQAMEQLRGIESKSTKLSLKAVIQAGLTYLEIDSVVTLAFVAAQLAGAQWITLWDLFRWYREGRFGVSNAQLHALGLDIDQRDRTMAAVCYHRERHILTGSIPLCNAYRILTYFAYTTKIPASLTYPPLHSLIDRYLGILNLPYVFRFRCLALADLVTEPDLRIGSSLCDTYPIQKGFHESLLTQKRMSSVKYFDHVFIDERCQHPQTRELIFLGPEIKVAALILLALKLTFGLDSEQEYEIPHDTDDLETFVFHDWLIQLRLRLKVWEGGAVEEVLSETSLDIDEILLPTHNFRRRHAPDELYHGYRRFQKNYKGVVPLRDANDNSDKFFQDLTKPKHTPDEPLAKDYSIRALYSPLETQAIIGLDALDEDDGLGISQAKKDVFVADFGQKIIHGPTEFDEHIDSATLGFLKLFPCADKFHRIPLPPTSNRIITLAGRPVAYRQHMESFYRSSERFFSAEFQRLLKIFGMIFGEEPSVLFYAFVMLENYYFMRDESDIIEEYLRSGEGVQQMIDEKVVAEPETGKDFEEVLTKWFGQPQDVKRNVRLVEPTIETKREFLYKLYRGDFIEDNVDSFIDDADESDDDEEEISVYSDEASYDGEGMDVDEDEVIEKDGGGGDGSSKKAEAGDENGNVESAPTMEDSLAALPATLTQDEDEAMSAEDTATSSRARTQAESSHRESSDSEIEPDTRTLKTKKRKWTKKPIFAKDPVSTDLCFLFLHWRYW